jgi:3-hydroxymyristoyl/3-hydroxydecanoyl-(acyl carrier protein) dehydratase
VEPIALPRRFRLVAALPRESNGKLVKARLRALFLSDLTCASDRAGAVAPAIPASAVAPPIPARTAAERQDAELELELKVSATSPLFAFFQGHFRDFPVLPGVVQLNNVVLHAARRRWPALGRLERVVSLKFRSPIRPDDHLAVHLSRADHTKVTFEIKRAAKIVSSGVLRFSPAGRSGSEQTT